MSEWAQQAAKQLGEDEAEQKHKDDVYAKNRAHILADAPRLWEALKETLCAEITAFNQQRPNCFKMNANFQGLPAINIECEQSMLDARFDAAIPDMKYNTKHPSGPFSGATIQGGYRFDVARNCVWFTTYTDKNRDVDYVAHEMLNGMLTKP